ncbi:MAG TPA: molybdenum cofactor guanylyltransferase [Rhizomicrobium sp.]|nr:molybdenum cofactor guanylyltransferase [Rhizomicrobium sp.]
MVHDPLEAAGHPPVLGVILVGGASRRYGHDKAMARLGGIPMVQRVATQVASQVSMLAASGAGRPGLDLAVIPDAVAHGGPLPALLSILTWAGERKLELVATFSCDTPFLPSDLVMRLHRALEPDRDCAVALHGGAAHPTCALWKVSALPKIQAAFDSGVRSLHGALAHLATCAVDFSDSDGGPGGDPFFNINSRSDMALAQAWIDRASVGGNVRTVAHMVFP